MADALRQKTPNVNNAKIPDLPVPDFEARAGRFWRPSTIRRMLERREDAKAKAA